MSFILLTHMITQHMCAGHCTYCCDVYSKAISQQVSHIANKCLHNVELLYTFMCVIRLAVKGHMVRDQRVHSGECTVPVVCAVQHSLQRGTF